MNKLYFLLFLSIFSAIYLGIHYYVYYRIATGLILSSQSRLYIRALFLFGAFSFLAGEFLTRQADFRFIRIFAYLGAVWMGIISIALTVLVFSDLLRVFFKSDKFNFYAVVVSLIIVVVLSIYSVINVLTGPSIKHIEIKTNKLPDNTGEFSIVHLSDLHIYFMNSDKLLKKIVNKTNELNPDVVVITGDLIDADICHLKESCRVLNSIKSKYGVFAVTGNHEYYAGFEIFMKIAEESGIKVLCNDSVSIQGIELAGINDPAATGVPESGLNLKKALSMCDFKKPVILLSHQPDIFDAARAEGVDLQLSGHTHAGQIPPMDIIVRFYFKYPHGLYRKGNAYLYTSAGTGIWGPPMRTTSRSEIVKITLKK
ncbi:MAG: putative metallophosphoesterase [Elusimicrobia bacterium ADurb.Bin231]|nr:MAG: putative metallophosphoesterase [Elusimicrobia bacterium ADurb.Bin231]